MTTPEEQYAQERGKWFAQVMAERHAQLSKHGYTADHDDEHGIKHLTNWLLEYIRTGQDIKAGAMVLAIEAWLVRNGHEMDILL